MTPFRLAWNRPLRELLPAMERELDRLDLRAYDCVVVELPQGAVLRLARGDDRRRVLSIGRRERPATARGLTLWDRELATFAKHLHITDWVMTPIVPKNGGIAAVFVEPAAAPAPPQPSIL